MKSIAVIRAVEDGMRHGSNLLPLFCMALLATAPVATSAPAPASAPAATSAPAARPKPAKPTTAPREALVTIIGQLDLVYASSLFGSGTRFDNQTGALVSEMSGPSLAIDYQGQSLQIEVNPQTRLDDSLKSGVINTGATYRVTGFVRKDRIVATAMRKEKDAPEPPPVALPAAPPPAPATTAVSAPDPAPAPATVPASINPTQVPPLSQAAARPAPRGPIAESLAGSAWEINYRSPTGEHVSTEWEFLPSGRLANHAVNDRTPDNDYWIASDTTVAVMLNDAYVTYTGSLSGRDRMSGQATNVTGKHWQWEGRRTR